MGHSGESPHEHVEDVMINCLVLYKKFGKRDSGGYCSGNRQIYCDMELECGGYKGGWTRIVSLNTSKGDSCPKGWNTDNSYCTGGHGAGCYSVTFPTHIKYRRICGRLGAYQKASMNAFYPTGYALGTASGYQPEKYSASINGPYVDGISITTGSPRKHLWTYAVGLSEDYRYNYTIGGYNCPCAATPGPQPPSFVQNHYYCESGNVGRFTRGKYYTEDLLWDGLQCTEDNNCCAQVGQPYFFRQLPVPKSGDIEVRICRDQNTDDEGVLLEHMELFVQ